MASSNQKAKLRRALWTMLRDQNGETIEIERDPLHARYEVNRHGIQVWGDDLNAVRDQLINALKAAGWTIEPYGSETIALPPEQQVTRASLGVPFKTPYTTEGRKMRWDISVLG
jgi:hypothetical protein